MIRSRQYDIDRSNVAIDVLPAMKNPDDLQLLPLDPIENDMAGNGNTANARR